MKKYTNWTRNITSSHHHITYCNSIKCSSTEKKAREWIANLQVITLWSSKLWKQPPKRKNRKEKEKQDGTDLQSPIPTYITSNILLPCVFSSLPYPFSLSLLGFSLTGMINEAFWSCRSLPTQLTGIMQLPTFYSFNGSFCWREKVKALFSSPTYLSKTSCATATLYGCLVVTHLSTERRVNQCRFCCTEGDSLVAKYFSKTIYVHLIIYVYFFKYFIFFVCACDERVHGDKCILGFNRIYIVVKL